MPIIKRSGGTSTTNNSTTSIVLLTPTGVVSTDVVLALIGFTGGTGTTVTPPSGWTLIKRQDNGTAHGMVTYWALGSVASYTFTMTAVLAIGYSYAFIGVDNTTPMDVSNSGQTNAASTTATAAAITTQNATEIVGGAYIALDTAAGNHITFSGWGRGGGPNYDWFTGTVVVQTLGIAFSYDGSPNQPGTTGTLSLTMSASFPSVAVLFALNASSGGSLALLGVGN